MTKEIKLFPHQETAIKQLFNAWNAGARSVVMTAPTGVGKTIMALWIMKYAQDRGRKVLFIANRRLLVDQAWASADEYGVDYGIIMANANEGNISSSNQVASVQTLESWYFYDKLTGELCGKGLPAANLVVLDECFSGDTLIDTPEGPRRIDVVRCGDSVYNATGIGIVTGLFKRDSRDIYTIGLTNGREITCTGNHPFFTGRGWIAAREMVVGEGTYGAQDMPNLWGGIRSSATERVHNSRNLLESPEYLLSVLLKEVQEPNEQQGVCCENEGEASRDKAQTYQAWWEREAAITGSACHSARTRGGMGSGASCGDKVRRPASGLPQLLQDRYCQQEPNGGNRDRRQEPRSPSQEVPRPEKDSSSGAVRVAYISRHQRKSPRTVFNISVSGHPSYFANGRLVHNCHNEQKRYRQLLQLYPDAKFLCLTATPVGPDGRSIVPVPFDSLIEPVKNSELIRDGFLLSTTVFAPSEPDIKGVGVDSGKEYNQAALGRAVREVTLFADIFKEWQAYQDQATVVFVPGIAYGRDIVNQFNNRLGATFPGGKAAHLIEAKTKQEERKRILDGIAEHGRGVVVSCDVLREGFNAPVISVAIDLQPNSQLRTYWQKVGRIKRTYPGQRVATYLDFAGNYWRFPHPNEDPEWPIGGIVTTQEIIEKRRAEKTDPQPIACPRCGMVRISGPACPGCGHTSGDPVRRVRMGDGRLVEIPLEVKKKKEITNEQRAYNEWKSCLFGALYKGWTYGQCAFIYRKKTGDWPKDNWPGVFGRQSLDQKRRPSDEYSKSELNRLLIDRSPS